MRRTTRLSVILAIAIAALGLPGAANADFGFEHLDVTFTDAEGNAVTQAGAHPFAMQTKLDFNSRFDAKAGKVIPDEELKDLVVDQIVGWAGDPRAVPRCASADFFLVDKDHLATNCPPSTAVGFLGVRAGDEGASNPNPNLSAPVYNLVPPPGTAAKIGFNVIKVFVTITAGVRSEGDRNIVATLQNVPQAKPVFGSVLDLWGNPAAPAHDEDRGICLGNPQSCPVSNAIPVRPFITLPRACRGPLQTTFQARSWQTPGVWVTGQVTTHDDSEPPVDFGMTNCEKLGFAPRITAQPTSDQAESPSGLDFSLDIDDQGLTSPTGIANSDIEKAKVTLPEGVTINPSQAEGLGVCSEEDLARETADSKFGAGCPASSKIGTIEVETPLLEGEILKGSLFVAKPHANLAGDALIAFYMVIQSPELGVLVKQAFRVDPDPETGQLVTTTENLPQVPFSHFRLRFREGGRSPLVTPPRCGTYTTEAVFTPWANPSDPLTTTSSFKVRSGVGGAPCPPAGPQPFEPGLTAGTLNNDAGSYSPFNLRLTRRDGDQDLTRFDATLPPGVTGKLAGIERCPDEAIAATKVKTGLEELTRPSCPAGSKIGRVLAGAGVGSQLTYVPGSVYLAGPFGKAPLSVVGVVPAVAGPFDVGTVVTRQALEINPKSALVTANGALSDPIPHILAGIPVRVRDIRVYVDRPEFTLNPTGCNPKVTLAAIWGGGQNPFSLADDAPVSRTEPFQAANCAKLGFKPRLGLKLRGSATKRGGHPALTAVLRPRPGDANIAGAAATLPRSVFLDQAHIRTVCTRVQFAADNCPKAAIYGRAVATTPLLDFPVRGPVYLRSSDNLLPDLVADLRGPASLPIKFEVVGRTDSIRGGLRNTFEATPDVPVSRFVLSLQGGGKGLLINSTDICRRPHRAEVIFKAHNGRRAVLRPELEPSGCAKQSNAHKRKR